MFDKVVNTLLQKYIKFEVFYAIFVKRSFLDVLQGYEYASSKCIVLGTIISRERKKLTRGFMKDLLLVHRPKKFQGKSLFYKINTFLQKIITCIGLQAEQIFIVNI